MHGHQSFGNEPMQKNYGPSTSKNNNGTGCVRKICFRAAGQQLKDAIHEEIPRFICENDLVMKSYFRYQQCSIISGKKDYQI